MFAAGSKKQIQLGKNTKLFATALHPPNQEDTAHMPDWREANWVVGLWHIVALSHCMAFLLEMSNVKYFRKIAYSYSLWAFKDCIQNHGIQRLHSHFSFLLTFFPLGLCLALVTTENGDLRHRLFVQLRFDKGPCDAEDSWSVDDHHPSGRSEKFVEHKLDNNHESWY